MAISKEQIISAANELSSKGITPSMQKIRDHLGGGSLSTISPILREWKENQAVAITTIAEMPSEMKAAIESVGAEVWRSASKLASKELELLKADSLSKVSAAELERDEALSEITKLENGLSSVSQELGEFKVKCDAMTQESMGLKLQVSTLENKIKDHNETVSILRSDKEELMNLLKAQQEQFTAQNEQLSELMTQINIKK